ncbi:hypothetical protein IVB36_21580 [Bradyrhizobium sp. 35]|uniref:hypothetical protein n=1 Tax=Bradyrhizobium sp. 35 TaxID=2782670 RepID=UPI001FF8DB0E|nr:hypothetical protein [Bradyrhizobium sp. 35]MCK1453398.1 hypothetical protein [Bradyrhizobium sp. 35]
MTNTVIALLAFALLTGAASAQQRALYNARGNVVGRSSTDSQGMTTAYDTRGKMISRESTTRTKNDWPTKDDCYGRPALMSGKALSLVR